MIYIVALLLSVFLPGCNPHSVEDFHHEGQAYSRALIRDLQKVHTREELAQATSHLKKHFEKLVDLMIRARTFQEEHPEESLSAPFQSETTISDELEEALRRIYLIEGGREIIERTQQEALVRLDAFERSCIKKKQAY
jgi:3-methyladenine DNA glycosylase Tag